MGWAGALRSAGLVAVLLGASSIAACGGGTPAPPSGEKLVRMLVPADELGKWSLLDAKWSLDLGTKNGHVPDLEDWGPQPFVCGAAGDAPAKPVVVSWEATRAWVFAGRSETVPESRRPWDFDVRLQEYLLDGSARTVQSAYDAFVSSMIACEPRMLGPNYSGRTTTIALPAVGDARVGIETSYLGKGDVRFTGNERTVLVLDGTVLMAVTLNEQDYVEGPPWLPEPQIGDAEVGAIVRTMVDQLG